MERKNQQADLQRLQRSLKDRGQKLRGLEMKLEDLETQIAANQAAVERSKNYRLRKSSWGEMILLAIEEVSGD